MRNRWEVTVNSYQESSKDIIILVVTSHHFLCNLHPHMQVPAQLGVTHLQHTTAWQMPRESLGFQGDVVALKPPMYPYWRHWVALKTSMLHTKRHVWKGVKAPDRIRHRMVHLLWFVECSFPGQVWDGIGWWWNLTNSNWVGKVLYGSRVLLPCRP